MQLYGKLKYVADKDKPPAATGQIGLKPALHIGRKPCICNIYCFGNAFRMKHNASIVESCKRDLDL